MNAKPVGPITATGPAPQTTVRTQGTATAGDPPSVDSAKRVEDKTKQAVDAPVQRDPRTLQFQVESGRVITTILDANNKTVVMQIPDAEVIRIAKSIDRMQGFLLEQKA